MPDARYVGARPALLRRLLVPAVPEVAVVDVLQQPGAAAQPVAPRPSNRRTSRWQAHRPATSKPLRQWPTLPPARAFRQSVFVPQTASVPHAITETVDSGTGHQEVPQTFIQKEPSDPCICYYIRTSDPRSGLHESFTQLSPS